MTRGIPSPQSYYQCKQVEEVVGMYYAKYSSLVSPPVAGEEDKKGDIATTDIAVGAGEGTETANGAASAEGTEVANGVAVGAGEGTETANGAASAEGAELATGAASGEVPERTIDVEGEGATAASVGFAGASAASMGGFDTAASSMGFAEATGAESGGQKETSEQSDKE